MQTSTRTHDANATREMPSIPANDPPSLPPAPTLVGPPGDTCSSCGSPMATDQRYCIECGERRGESRLTSLEQATASAPPAAAPAAAYAPPAAAAPGRKSSGIALIATIALLLLSMGVGVLIGNKGGDSSSGTAQQPVIIGAAGATAATGATDTTGATDSKSSADAGAASSDASGANADALAKKNGVKLAPKDAKIGDKCDKGAVGCNDKGEFDGNYFGQ